MSAPFSLVFPRTEKAVTASNDEEDLLIAGEFHKTLAELDEDLEGKNHLICYSDIMLHESRCQQ